MDADKVAAVAERMRKPLKGTTGSSKPPLLQAKILLLLAARGPLSPRDLILPTGKSRFTVYAGLHRLEARGWVRKQPDLRYDLTASGREFVG